jgi:hypothetical protein
MPVRILLAACVCCTLLAMKAGAEVRVLVGPTPILGGEAKSAADITVVGERLAFSLAVDSAVPYGVPRGALIDLAAVTNGRVGADRVVFADFIPNNWSAWPNTYQHVDILERGPDRAVLRSVRDWGEVTIETVYTLRTGADAIEIRTTMHNAGSVAVPDLLSGLSVWPKGGYLFAVPGMAGVEEGAMAGRALADRFSGYDEDWSVTLHAPYADHVADGSRSLYEAHSLAPGETRSFDSSLQVGPSGDLAPVLAAEIERGHLPSGTVSGVVTAPDGHAIDKPVVIVERQGKPYAWCLGRNGRYTLRLAAGDYSLYATAKNHSNSRRVELHVAAGAQDVRDFHDVERPGELRFLVRDSRSGEPKDARITIREGNKPVVQFLGKKTFFTELAPRGRVDVPIAPGDYVFEVSAGGGFLAENVERPVHVSPGAPQTVSVQVTPLFAPREQGWYSADLHHHGDQAEAVTPPADLARSQFAAGLDLLFVSDHDSTVNHHALQAIADTRGVAFIPSVELSPSWGHFNAYPLSLGAALRIDTGTATIGQILGEARRLGAIAVQANHPFIPYGYLTSVAGGVAPGGFDPGFDLLEINADDAADDPKVLSRLWSFWNQGHRYYLTAGTDTHDVWNEVSGRVRAFVHLDAKPSAAAFARGLTEGHAYVSYGPLIFPSVLFGSDLKATPDVPFTLGFDVASVAGIRSVQLIRDGREVETRDSASLPRTTRVEFSLRASQAGWAAVIVEDGAGHKAYTDPIWIDVVAHP